LYNRTSVGGNAAGSPTSRFALVGIAQGPKFAKGRNPPSPESAKLGAMAECLVIQHVEAEGPYALGDALRSRGVDLVVRRMDAGQSLPSGVDGFAGLVVMGGPMSAAGSNGFPSRTREISLLSEAVGQGLPTLGVCLGAQLLALSAGGSVFPGPHGPEVGWGVVRLTGSADDDPLLSGLPRGLTVLHWHGDTFSLPPGSIRLASSRRYREQAFRCGSSAWGLQFHVEVDAGGVAAMARCFGSDVVATGSTPEDLMAATPTGIEALGPHRATIADRFAALVSG
jgi:GMP synthase-like glutamine amidotransferase